MNKTQKLELLMLLSAIESWAFAVRHPFPDYIQDRLMYSVENLCKQVLEDSDGIE